MVEKASKKKAADKAPESTAKNKKQVLQKGQRIVSVNDALSIASEHQRAGRLKQAEIILQRIIKSNPKDSRAIHLLGIVAQAAGNKKAAIQLINKAIQLTPKAALYHANIGEIYRQMGEIDAAITHGKKAITLDPKLTSAHSNLGIAFFDKEDYDKAEKCQKMALKLNPNFSPALNNMVSIYREKKEDAKAVAFYKKAFQCNPKNLEPLNNLGATFLRLDKPKDSIAVLQRVLKEKPNYPEAISNLGFALNSLDRERDAVPLFQKALKIKPDHIDAYLGLARSFNNLHELEKAEKCIKKALEIDANSAEAYISLGSIHLSQGYTEKAKDAFKKAEELKPGIAGAKHGLGNVYLEEGKFEEAEKLFREVISKEKGGDRLGSLFSLTQTRKIKPDEDIVKMLQEEEKNIGQLSEGKAIYVHFALGKVYDDIGEHEKSFPHFIEGCRLKRKTIKYDIKNSEKNFTRIKEIFSKDFIKNNKGNGYKSDVPIFVLGMPRSGTTLTEQIIASHPDVYGAGELFDLLDLNNWKGQNNSPAFPENILKMKDRDFSEMGKAYVEGLKARNPEALKITDKMPANFFHIGLIHLILPNAKIVHVQRNPLDTCISCFTRLFSHNQNNTYDLKELGAYYRLYADLMDHWKKVLPKNSFYNISYESLVENNEEEAKKLIEFCDLKWDDSCLEFHKNKRNIRTASVTQVRQPIYKSSVDRWKKYEKFIEPLVNSLGDRFVSL